jgi:hypothetical protein
MMKLLGNVIKKTLLQKKQFKKLEGKEMLQGLVWLKKAKRVENLVYLNEPSKYVRY